MSYGSSWEWEPFPGLTPWPALLCPCCSLYTVFLVLLLLYVNTLVSFMYGGGGEWGVCWTLNLGPPTC